MMVRESPVRLALLASILSACLQATLFAQGVPTPTYPGAATRVHSSLGSPSMNAASAPSSPYLSPSTKAIIGGGVARPLQFPPQEGAPAPSAAAGAMPPGPPSGPPLASAPSPEGAVTSKDFLKLMEEANASRGIGVYGGEFPGAKKIPQANSTQPAFQQTLIPPRPVSTVPSAVAVPPSAVGSSESTALGSESPKPFLPPPIPFVQPPAPSQIATVTPGNIEPVSPSPSQQVPGAAFQQPTTPTAMLGAVPEWNASQANVPTSPGMLAPRVSSQPQVSNLPYPSPNPGQPYTAVAPNPSIENPNFPVVTDPSFGGNSASMPAPQSPAPQAPVQPFVLNANGPGASYVPPLERAPGRTVSQDAPAIPPKAQRRHHVVGGYDSIWMERTGDQSMSYSQGSTLGSFGTEQAGLYTIGYMMDPMEILEFQFLGTFHWERQHQALGPVDSTLVSNEPAWLQNFNAATSHEQRHQATLRSYALNKKLITDDLGSSYYGLNIIDYSEDYRFQSSAPSGVASMGISTANILAGMHAGMELWRPFSQRFSLGGQGACGLYANFADANWTANSGNGLALNATGDDWNLAFKLGIAAKARYQFNSAFSAYGGYDWTYLGGLATAENQPTNNLASQPSFSMTTNAGFLLQSASCGLEFRY